MSQVEMRSSEAARQAHEWLVGSGLYSNIIDSAGKYDSKIEPAENTSLAAHILNAVTVAVNSFVYEAFSPGDDIQEYEKEIRVLAAATALHDTNKYVREAYGFEADGNTEAAFDVYFGENESVDIEGDDFGIEDGFLGSGYRNDLLYLVQRCEIGEDSTETRRIDTEFRGLERYVRTGDQVTSIAQREGVRGVYRKLREKFDEEEVHLLTFNALEQPVLNDLLIGSVKSEIAGENDSDIVGVPVGSTADTVVYLGNKIEKQELKSRVAETVPERITDDFNFSCKLNWNSFGYDILEDVGIPVEEKEEIIADAFRELLHDGKAGVEGFEHIPEEFDRYFPILAKSIYLDRLRDFDDPIVQDKYDELYKWDDQKVKIHFIAYLVNNLDQHREFLESLVEEVRPELHDDLEPEIDVINILISRFFKSLEHEEEVSKQNMCFLCGREASKPYSKGHETVYQAQGFSRRLPPHKDKSKGGKSICEVCDLEYSLIFNLCEKSGINLDRRRPGSRTLGVSIAYFYFDDFLGDIRLRSNRIGIELSDTLDLGSRELSVDILSPQYFIQPFSFGDHPDMSDKNHRMVAVRQIMRTAQESGMKVVIGRPFTRFQSADSVFKDEEATRPQELLGLDEAERFGPLPDFVDRRTDSHLNRALALFKIMSMVGQDGNMNNPYLQLDRDTYHSIANFAVVNHDNATGLSDLQEYFETYHSDALMKMKTVAERGVDLFGEQHDSKYKKTKVFREALDAFLSGMNQNMSDDELVEYVESQVYAAADREDYAGHVDTEDADAFVEALRSYLVENDLYDLKKLSDWEDALVNSYYYAYDQILYD